jgi:hypothetical protein
VGESDYWESASESGWDFLRIFLEMRVKVPCESTTCESMARGESLVLKSACDSASSESACE